MKPKFIIPILMLIMICIVPASGTIALSAQTTSSTITWSWPAGLAITKESIDGVLINNFDPSVTSFDLTGLPTNENHTFCIYTTGDSGCDSRITSGARNIQVTGGNIDVAQTITLDPIQIGNYTCNPDEKISILQYDLPINTKVNFTLYYGTGSTVSGWIDYHISGIGQSYSEVHIGSDDYAETFIDSNQFALGAFRKIQFVSYARDNSKTPYQTGFAIYAQGFGLYSGELAFFPVDNLPSNMIYAVSFNSNQDIGFIAVTNKADKLAQFISETVGENQQTGVLSGISQLASYATLIWNVFSTAIYWLKFIFVDNIVLTFSLYLMGTAAYCMMTSRNIFEFFKKFFRFQKSFVEFVIYTFNSLVDMISKLIQALKPI